VPFHALNRATGNRVHARYVDAETGKPVGDEDQVRGYERGDDEYVMFEDEELEAGRRWLWAPRRCDQYTSREWARLRAVTRGGAAPIDPAKNLLPMLVPSRR
jgi:Ku70/Ku80 beta-barrel domain